MCRWGHTGSCSASRTKRDPAFPCSGTTVASFLQKKRLQMLLHCLMRSIASTMIKDETSQVRREHLWFGLSTINPAISKSRGYFLYFPNFPTRNFLYKKQKLPFGSFCFELNFLVNLTFATDTC